MCEPKTLSDQVKRLEERLLTSEQTATEMVAIASSMSVTDGAWRAMGNRLVKEITGKDLEASPADVERIVMARLERHGIGVKP